MWAYDYHSLIRRMILTLFFTTLLVGLAVVIHYEVFLRTSLFMLTRPGQPRFVLVMGILCALLAHIVETVIFAVGYYGLIQAGHYGTLLGDFTHGFDDCVYFSFVTYTTLGFGDLIPTGPLRFLTGVEALSGLVLIAWTASFLYLQMQKLLGKIP